MQKKINFKKSNFMPNVPLLDNDFDTGYQETFDIITAQAEINDAEHKISMLN